MPSIKLTDRYCQNAQPPEQGQLDNWDSTTKGFGLPLNTGGKKTFFVIVRVKGLGVRHRVTLGPYLSLARARKAALGVIEHARLGIDPKEKADAEREAKATAKREADAQPKTKRQHEHVLEAVQRRLDETPEAMRARRETAGHPFGTIKARMGATHFLMKRLKNIRTEMALSVLA